MATRRRAGICMGVGGRCGIVVYTRLPPLARFDDGRLPPPPKMIDATPLRR